MSTILILDDMAIIRDPIAFCLHHAGHETVCAASGPEAQRLLQKQKVDLILMDIALARGDGLGFLHCLRTDPKTAAVPVIILTALSDRKNVLQSLQLGVREYLLKSRFGLDDLLERICKKLLPTPAKKAAAVKSNPANPSLGAAGAMKSSREQVNQVEHRVNTRVADPATTHTDAAPAIPQLLTRDQCINRAEKALGAKTLSGVVGQVLSLASSPRGAP